MPELMLSVVQNIAVLAFSVLLLAYSSDYFTEGAARVARRLGVSRFIIGAVVIGFGTSSPELFSSVYASLMNAGGVALGNVVGSNIANIGLILGSAAFIRPALVRQKIEYINAAACLLLTALAALLILAGGVVSRTDGFLLLGVFAVYIYYSIKNPNNTVYARDTDEDSERAAVHLLLGLGGVLAGSILLVNSAVAVARGLGVPESVIGLTLVAFGTSVPELAVSIVAARKGYYTMVVGNVVGSNVFNILLVLGAAAVAAPIPADAAILYRSIPAVLFITGAMLLFMRTGWRVSRIEGAVLLLFYLGFLRLSFGAI